MAARAELDGLISSNRVPIVDVKVDAEVEAADKLTVRIDFTNVGPVPAYNLRWELEGVEKKGFHPMPVCAPGQRTYQTVMIHYIGDGLCRRLIVEYDTCQGHKIVDEYQILVSVQAGALVHGAQCVSKTYHVAKPGYRPYVIAD